MAKFGNWQMFMDTCVQSLENDSEGFDSFKKLQNNEERISFVLRNGILKTHWIEDFFEVAQSVSNMKSISVASQHRKEGNGNFQRKQFSAALHCYNQLNSLPRESLTRLVFILKAMDKLHTFVLIRGDFEKQLDNRLSCVCYAPVNDSQYELSLGFANRSAAFYHLENYELCLNDIESAFNSGYPADMTYKLILRKGQCLAHLGQWEKAKTAVLLAKEKLLEQPCSDAKKRASVLKEMEDLLTKMDEKSLGKTQKCRQVDDKKSKIPVPVCGYSSTVKQATSAMDLRYSPEKGRHLVANRKINAGDVLIVEQPYAAVLLPSHYVTNCQHCFAKVQAVVPGVVDRYQVEVLVRLPGDQGEKKPEDRVRCFRCSNCASVVYCSRMCQVESWMRYHRTECTILDLLHSVGIAHLSLRIVLMTQLQPLLDFREELLNEPNDTSKLTLGLTPEGSYERNYLSVYSLMPHTDDMAIEDLYQYALTASLLLTILEKSHFFDLLCTSEKMTEGNQTDQLQSKKLFVGSLLLRHICQLVCNAHAITDLELTQFSKSSLVDTQSQVRVATAIYPTTSLLNHSCDPTIISSFRNEMLIVRAVKDVDAGEEIFNCYGPHCKRMARSDRLQHLREQYFFDCKCGACHREQNQELYFKALRCRLCKGPVIEDGEKSYSCMACGQSCDVPLSGLCRADDLFAQGLKLLDQQEIDDALVAFKACLKIRESCLHSMNKDLSEVHDAVAQCYAVKGDFVSAHDYLSKSIQATEQLYGSSSIELANELQKFSEVSLHAGKTKDAVTAAKRACDLFAMNYGPDCDAVSELRKFANLTLETEGLV